jgi:hypothetical protein
MAEAMPKSAANGLELQPSPVTQPHVQRSYPCETQNPDRPASGAGPSAATFQGSAPSGAAGPANQPSPKTPKDNATEAGWTENLEPGDPRLPGSKVPALKLPNATQSVAATELNAPRHAGPNTLDMQPITSSPDAFASVQNQGSAADAPATPAPADDLKAAVPSAKAAWGKDPALAEVDPRMRSVDQDGMRHAKPSDDMKKPVNQDEVAALRLQNLPTTEQELALKASGLIVRQKKAMLEVPGEAAFHPGMRSPDSETQVSLQPMSAEAARSARTMVSHMEAGFSREVELLRQFKADSMAVVIRPDDRTQISLRLTMHDGHVNIFARCEEGDFNRLAGHWV